MCRAESALRSRTEAVERHPALLATEGVWLSPAGVAGDISFSRQSCAPVATLLHMVAPLPQEREPLIHHPWS